MVSMMGILSGAAPLIVDVRQSGSAPLVSSTVKDLVAGSGIDFEDRGEHELKGVPGTWHLYSVVT